MQATLLFCDQNDLDFIALTQALDKELHEMYGAEQSRYDALNTLEGITPVSYTHLDVYKRQSLRWILSRRDAIPGMKRSR